MRVKGGTVSKDRRRKVLKEAKGYFGSKHRLYKTAQEQLFHSYKYAYRDRKQNKRNFRKLWITRINAACRENNISYSMFINGLNIANILVNRKMLSEIAISNPSEFSKLVEISKNALENKTTVIKEKDVVKNELKKEENNDLSKLTVLELKKLAKEKSLKNYNTMKKNELLDALK